MRLNARIAADVNAMVSVNEKPTAILDFKPAHVVAFDKWFDDFSGGRCRCYKFISLNL